MRNIAVSFRLAGTCRRVRAAEARRGHRRRSTPPLQAAFPTAPADWKARLEQDETMKPCSLHENAPPKAVAEAIADAREGQDRISGRRQAPGRLDVRREARAIGLRAPLHRLSRPPGQRRQLLRLPSVDQGRSQLRHHRPEPARITARIRNFSVADTKAAYEKIYNAQAAYPCSNMPRFGTNKVLTIDQIKDLVALVMSPDSPVNK